MGGGPSKRHLHQETDPTRCSTSANTESAFAHPTKAKRGAPAAARVGISMKSAESAVAREATLQSIAEAASIHRSTVARPQSSAGLPDLAGGRREGASGSTEARLSARCDHCLFSDWTLALDWRRAAGSLQPGLRTHPRRDQHNAGDKHRDFRRLAGFWQRIPFVPATFPPCETALGERLLLVVRG